MPPTIYLADVAPHARRLAAGFLQLGGYRVEIVFDGNSALETIRSAPVGLLIADVTLPGLDGYELTRTLKHEYPRFPVLLMAVMNARHRALEAGANAFLQKPIEGSSFLSVVESLAPGKKDP